MANLLKYAIKYAEKGFYVVPTIKKKPIVRFADRPALTPDELTTIWQENRFMKLNIALRTEQFFVVDIDRHAGGADGLKTMRDLHHREWFKDTLYQKTAHGGYQFFFAKPKERIAQNIDFLPGVDIKAHRNNYVVVAPSVIDGGAYQWLNHKPMSEAPEGLLQLIESKTSQSSTTDPKLLHYTIKGHNRTAELFETIANGLGDKGQRNDTLTSLIGGLLFRGVDPDSAFQLAQIANQNTADALPEHELVATVNSMIRREARRREIINEQNRKA